MMGLVTLTHTPNPISFPRELLGRGTNEKAVRVMPVGYPRPDAKVPDLQRVPRAPQAAARSSANDSIPIEPSSIPSVRIAARSSGRRAPRTTSIGR